jgi:hypothetical protein
VEPAAVADYRVEPGLALRLMQDARTEDALPLLAFVLAKLWDRRDRANSMLTLAEYVNMGGLDNAVGAQAERIFVDLRPSPAETAQFRSTLLFGMTAVPSDGRILRKPMRREAIPKGAVRLIDAFIAARLLIASESEIEVAHEAIYYHWLKLAGWLKEEEADLQARQRIVDAYRSWQEEQINKPSRLLPPGRPLEEGRALLDKPGATEGLAKFIKDSINAENAREEERQARQRRRQQLRVAFAAAALLLIAVAIVGFRQAAIAESRRLASSSVSVQEDDPELAILIASLGVAELGPWGHSVLPEVEQQLHRALLASRVRFTVIGPKDSPMFVPLNPDGKQLATGRSDGSVVIQDLKHSVINNCA